MAEALKPGPGVVTPTTELAEHSAAGARLHFFFLNIGHFLDHLFMLVFSTAAAVVLVHEWGLTYSELIPYATPGFIAFAAFTIPAGWLADRYGREILISVFFIGCGFASIACAFASSPLQIAVCLFFVGVFASIYHPVGIALVLEGNKKTGLRVASNGVWGNLGVAVAALLTGALIDAGGWRSAFVVPAIVSILFGLTYYFKVRRYSPSQLALSAAGQSAGQKTVSALAKDEDKTPAKSLTASSTDSSNDVSVDHSKAVSEHSERKRVQRVLAIVLLTTACGGVVFQSTTFALPKVLLEKSGDYATSATTLGWIAFIVFAIGSIGQLIVGYLLDRGSARRVFMAVAFLQVVFFALAIGAQGLWVPFIASGFMLAAFGQIPINDVLVGRVTNTLVRSRILAIRYTVTLSTMALSVPLISTLHARGGVASLFVLLTVMALIILIATRFLPKDV